MAPPKGKAQTEEKKELCVPEWDDSRVSEIDWTSDERFDDETFHFDFLESDSKFCPNDVQWNEHDIVWKPLKEVFSNESVHTVCTLPLEPIEDEEREEEDETVADIRKEELEQIRISNESRKKENRCVHGLRPPRSEAEKIIQMALLISEVFQEGIEDGNYLWERIHPKEESLSGKYCVKLFFRGKEREVVVDDKIPLLVKKSEEGEENEQEKEERNDKSLLPVIKRWFQGENVCEIWPLLLCKAIMRISRIEKRFLDNEFLLSVLLGGYFHEQSCVSSSSLSKIKQRLEEQESVINRLMLFRIKSDVDAKMGLPVGEQLLLHDLRQSSDGKLFLQVYHPNVEWKGEGRYDDSEFWSSTFEEDIGVLRQDRLIPKDDTFGFKDSWIPVGVNLLSVCEYVSSSSHVTSCHLSLLFSTSSVLFFDIQESFSCMERVSMEEEKLKSPFFLHCSASESNSIHVVIQLGTDQEKCDESVEFTMHRYDPRATPHRQTFVDVKVEIAQKCVSCPVLVGENVFRVDVNATAPCTILFLSSCEMSVGDEDAILKEKMNFFSSNVEEQNANMTAGKSAVLCKYTFTSPEDCTAVFDISGSDILEGCTSLYSSNGETFEYRGSPSTSIRAPVSANSKQFITAVMSPTVDVEEGNYTLSTLCSQQLQGLQKVPVLDVKEFNGQYQPNAKSILFWYNIVPAAQSHLTFACRFSHPDATLLLELLLDGKTVISATGKRNLVLPHYTAEPAGKGKEEELQLLCKIVKHPNDLPRTRREISEFKESSQEEGEEKKCPYRNVEFDLFVFLTTEKVNVVRNNTLEEERKNIQNSWASADAASKKDKGAPSRVERAKQAREKYFEEMKQNDEGAKVPEKTVISTKPELERVVISESEIERLAKERQKTIEESCQIKGQIEESLQKKKEEREKSLSEVFELLGKDRQDFEEKMGQECEIEKEYAVKRKEEEDAAALAAAAEEQSGENEGEQ